VAALAAALAVPAVILAGPDATATVLFGLPNTGSPFNNPPEVFHDASLTADERLVPGTVTISAGGSVEYEVQGFHQLAVYDAGTTLEDITPAGFFIDDPGDRLELEPPGVSKTVTFADPGRYLVLCNIAPHFFGGKMYGWVIVK
jgi:plastocyanin